MLDKLKGYKTYIVGSLQFLIALVTFITGDITLGELFVSLQGLVTILIGGTGLGLVALRAGIKNERDSLKV